MWYAELKYSLFSLIPGAGMANLIYFGFLVWLIAIYLSSQKWSAFYTTLTVGVIFKGIDFLFLGHSASAVLTELTHFMLIPLILTLVKNRFSRLG